MAEYLLGCGSCNLCCKLLAVPDIHKPARMLCWWTTIHGGCSRHEEKSTAPELAACASWKCVWLASQTHPDLSKRLPRHLRPDQCHVVLGPQDRDNPNLLYIHVDPAHPTSWKDSEIGRYIEDIQDRGGLIEVIVGESRVDMTGD